MSSGCWIPWDGNAPSLITTFFGTRSFGTLQGLTQSGTVVAGVIAPVLMGFVFDQTQSYVLSIYILMAVAALAIPVPLFARPPGRWTQD